MRHAARTDANHTEISKALRDIGVQVEYIKLPLDLLICIRGHTALVECKVGNASLTKAQVEFIERWPGKIFIARSTEEAVKLVYEWGETLCL